MQSYALTWILLSLITTQLACSTFRGPKPLRAPAADGNVAVVSGESDAQLRFEWPVDEARLTQRFLPHKKRRPHWGIDLASSRGSEIYASHYGTVVYTGNDFHGYGRLVVVETGPNWATFYSHLDKILVKEGQQVKVGDLIGLMGRSGRATGVHLHFEVRNNRMPVDPLKFLPGGENI
jgi:murein DD-endopeptidase MepM/ murein hydrolase activator NlpD